MNQLFCLLIVLVSATSFSEMARAQAMNAGDEYLELLEIEIAEKLCNNDKLRQQANVTAETCRPKALSAIPYCTKTLHHKAPRPDADPSSSRQSKSTFTSNYTQCLINRMNTPPW